MHLAAAMVAQLEADVHFQHAVASHVTAAVGETQAGERVGDVGHHSRALARVSGRAGRPRRARRLPELLRQLRAYRPPQRARHQVRLPAGNREPPKQTPYKTICVEITANYS